jgi:hypothetical protein
MPVIENGRHLSQDRNDYPCPMGLHPLSSLFSSSHPGVDLATAHPIIKINSESNINISSFFSSHVLQIHKYLINDYDVLPNALISQKMMHCGRKFS